ARIAAGHATAALEAGAPSAMLFKQARDLAPGDPELLLSTAAALQADGHRDVAEALLERALDVNPSWIRGHEALSSLRWTTAGDRTDFARSFGQGCARARAELALWIAWERALAQARQWDLAHAVLNAARAQFGALAEFDAAEAFIATECGDDAAAERLFAAAAAIDDPGTRLAHVRHCLRTGRIAQAEALALPLIEGPRAAAAWPYLSLIWRLTGDPRSGWLDGDPPFVAHYDLAFPPGELDRLAAHLRRLHTTKHHPAEQSLRGGTQTEGSLLLRADPALDRVRQLILDAVRRYVDALPAFDARHPLLGTPRHTLRFAGSWSVRLAAQGFHVCHTHPLGWISSALYVSLPEADGLGEPPAGWLELGTPPPDLRLDLPAYRRVEPKPGRLVLFPSTMWHGTIPFGDGERLTIAFDVAVPSR
ncbi:MAG: putative 2OG-Fe(II) oxygenase, partial [Sphingomonadaceae bacterium]